MWISYSRLGAWTLLVAVAILTLGPVGLRANLGILPDLDRVLGFAAFGFVFAIAYPKHLRLVIILTLLGIVLLEYGQTLTPDRHGSGHDILVKFAGASLGIGAAILAQLSMGRIDGLLRRKSPAAK